MKFYSYDYVLSQISQQNWVIISLSLILLLVTAFFAVKAYRGQKDSKFRELAIIFGLGLVVTVLIGFSNFQASQSSDNQFRNSLHFIEVVSADLDVDKSEVYVNTSALTDGAILKVEDSFYRAMGGSEPDTYLLERIELYNSANVELVEVSN